MARPVTLFTGQWADLTLEQLAAKCGEWEFDGLELACWGDHFDVAEALSDSSYCAGRREILERHDLNVLGDRQPPRRARRCATRSTAVMQACCRRRCGATGTPRASASAPRSA